MRLVSKPSKRNEHYDPEKGRTETVDTLGSFGHLNDREDGVIAVNKLEVKIANRVWRKRYRIDGFFFTNERLFFENCLVEWSL